MKKFNFTKRIVVMIFVPVILITIMVASVGIYNIVDIGYKDIESQLHSFCVSTLERYNALNDAEYVYEDGLFKKGDIVLTDNNTVIDKLKDSTDIETTVFYNDTRVATTITDENGNRVLGTKASDEVIETVLKRGESFYSSNIIIEGENCSGYYMPITQENGTEIVGMVFAGRARSELRATIIKAIIFTLIVIVIGLIINIIGTIFTSKHMSAAIVHTTNEIGKVSNGILAFDAQGKYIGRTDEIGDMARATKQVVESLSAVIGNIVETSEKLESFSENFSTSFDGINKNIGYINSAVNEIANGATSQAMETQEANNGVTQMGTAIDDTSKNVTVLKNSSDKMKEYNHEVHGTLDQLSQINTKTKEAVSLVYEQTNATNESVNEITVATDLITSIATQTNLLSLNASIEAARAGEMGRGFAVVADEIRVLSEQSRSSAEKIISLVKSLAQNSNSNVKTMNEMNDIMDEQNKMIDSTKHVFNSLNGEINNVAEAIASIGEQVSSLEKIKTNVLNVVESLAAIAEENAASAEETSASMNELQNIVHECTEVTNEMVTLSKELLTDTEQFKFEE